MRKFYFTAPFTNRKMEGVFRFTKYWVNSRLAISIIAKEADNNEDMFAPFCSVTVNLPMAKLDDEKLVFLDVNNAPWLEGFMVENGFGLPTGRFRTSGFCNYPEYILNLREMKRFATE